MLEVQRVTREAKQDARDPVIKELPLTIILNQEELATLPCSPTDLKYLAIGFLFSEGWLENKDEIKRITVDDQNGVVSVETAEGKWLTDRLTGRQRVTSGCARMVWEGYRHTEVPGLEKVKSRFSISAARVLALVRQFQLRSQLFKATGGVHSAALCDTKDIIVFSDDIGRHNAIDKILGRCLLDHITTTNRIIITSGRVSSETVLKVARMNIPVLVSRSAPTDLGVRLADSLGMTLVGFARGKKMNVYTVGERIVTDGEESNRGEVHPISHG